MNKTLPPVGYVIRCNSRYEERVPAYFVAIHGFTPFFGPLSKAKQFPTPGEATDYANKELFTGPHAFLVTRAE